MVGHAKLLRKLQASLEHRVAPKQYTPKPKTLEAMLDLIRWFQGLLGFMSAFVFRQHENTALKRGVYEGAPIHFPGSLPRTESADPYLSPDPRTKNQPRKPKPPNTDPSSREAPQAMRTLNLRYTPCARRPLKAL